MSFEEFHVHANDLKRADTIINVGKVVAVNPIGAFVAVCIVTNRWSLGDGLQHTHQEDLILHQADLVRVRRHA